jgi:hypothetical protein
MQKQHLIPGATAAAPKFRGGCGTKMKKLFGGFRINYHIDYDWNHSGE